MAKMASQAGVMSTDAYMGDGRTGGTPSDITRALKLATIAWALMTAAIVAAAIGAAAAIVATGAETSALAKRRRRMQPIIHPIKKAIASKMAD